MIKPIPTEYQGTTFRSRLEARWAVFFNALGIDSFYEYEGFKLDNNVWYLPDFYLPAQNIWLEVKPNLASVTKEALTKVKALSVNVLEDVFILYGPVSPQSKAVWFSAGLPMFNGFRWAQCPKCGFVNLEIDGILPTECELTCFTKEELKQLVKVRSMWNYNTFDLLDAYMQAKTMRFY